MSRPTPPKAGEIDPIKLFVIIIGAASVLIAGWCFFFLKSDQEDLKRANQAAEKSMRNARAMQKQCEVYLNHFKASRDDSGDGSAAGFFGKIRSDVGIANENHTLTMTDRDSGSGRDYTQIVTAISIKSATWEQIIEYMREVERQSPRYKILDISGLRRIDTKTDADAWRVIIKAAYRTQKQKR